MQINLKQFEIETALKMYISQQGISLASKTVGMVFTAGRKDGGLLVEITIEDATTVERRVTTPVLIPTEPEAVSHGQGTVASGDLTAAAITEPPGEAPVAPVKVTSLFN